MSQNEVVSQINGIAGPRNEVVDVRDIAFERAFAIKTRAGLEFVDDFADLFQICPFAAEQKFIQISPISQSLDVEPVFQFAGQIDRVIGGLPWETETSASGSSDSSDRTSEC